MWGREEASTSLGQLQTSQRGQAHKTHVVEGLDPVWTRGFRLKVEDRYTEALRIQILHKGYMATEFIGEVVIELAELVEVIEHQSRSLNGSTQVGRMPCSLEARCVSTSEVDSCSRGAEVPACLGSTSPRVAGTRWS